LSRDLTGLGSVSVGLVVLVLLGCGQPPPSRAETAQSQSPPVSSVSQVQPVSDPVAVNAELVPAPVRPEPLLRRDVPGLQEGMEKLPPFLRDTDLNLHVRTFYFDSVNPDESENEAWAIGGWLEYRSGWLLDTFAMGAVG
jgi:hypothetical protein